MATESTLFGEDYQTKFDGKTYIRHFYQNSEDPDDIRDVRKPMLKNWYDIVDKAGDLGERLLDLGTGPTIYTVMSPSRKVKEITLSDYVPSCVDELNKWLNKEPGAYDWTHWLTYAAQLEGNGVTASDIEGRIRNATKEVLCCDILQSNPLHPEERPQFDVITSQLAVDVGCKDMNDYRNAAKNIASLLKPGGHLFLAGALNCHYYYVGEARFHTIPLSYDVIKETYHAAGFEALTFDEVLYKNVENTNFTKVTDNAGTFFMHAVKSK